MPLPCPGPASISLGNIQTEFGGSNPAALSEYYRGKLWSFYRYFTNIYGNHFYTATSTSEYLTQNGYVLEYPNYFLAYKDNISGTTALYRLFNDNLTTKNLHLLTTDFSEYAYLIGQGWNDEGIVGYVYSSSVADSQPVYRWRKNDSTNYLFTTSGAETPADYTYESIGFYAPQFGAVAYVSDNNTNVPTSGAISLGNFFCAVDEIIVYITSNSENVNVQSLFGGYWTRTVSKRLVINSGVIVGATNTSNYALNIPSGFGGTFRLDNNGSIQGAGGVGSGVQGGNAIFAGAAGITINNLGTIYAGGGSGGTGGTGGAGSYTAQSGIQYSGIRNVNGPSYGADASVATIQAAYQAGCTLACKSAFGSNYYSATPCGYTIIGNDLCFPVCKGAVTTTGGCRGCGPYVYKVSQSETWNCVYDYNVASAGGAGGNGGPGQGYNQSAAGGSGGFDGGTNAGGGGTGGTGGAFGASGGNGFVGANGTVGTAPVLGAAGGPGYGGLAGYYIVNNGNVTWTATGTRLGGVA